MNGRIGSNPIPRTRDRFNRRYGLCLADRWVSHMRLWGCVLRGRAYDEWIFGLAPAKSADRGKETR